MEKGKWKKGREMEYGKGNKEKGKGVSIWNVWDKLRPVSGEK
jgi:hypothetical protein